MSANPSPIALKPERAAKAFLRPAAQGTPSTLGVFPEAERLFIDTEHGRVAAAQAGDGPTVLLVHGWEGRASDLLAFAPPLLEAGLRVLAIDLPAHGESEGRTTSIPQCAEALLAVGRFAGPLRAVLAHSVGTAIAIEAMARGLAVERAALIAVPARYADYARGFAAQAGLDPAQAEDMIDALLELGVDVRAISSPDSADKLPQPALLVHSEDDRVVPILDAAETAGRWRGARLLRVDKLGHRRLLQDPQVVAAVTRFIQGETA